MTILLTYFRAAQEMAKTHEEQMSTLHTAMNQQKSRIQELEKEISTITDNHELHLKQRVCHQIVRRHQIVRKNTIW